jgi:hypothetical protein
VEGGESSKSAATFRKTDCVPSFCRFSSVANFGTLYFLGLSRPQTRLKIKILAKHKRELTTKLGTCLPAGRLRETAVSGWAIPLYVLKSICFLFLINNYNLSLMLLKNMESPYQKFE